MNKNNLETKQQFWFRRKWYGWGWFPANWKGWVTILVYLILALVDAYGAERIHGDGAQWFFFGCLIGLSAIFIGVAWKKGESPCWQWGKPKN
jgi:uncharacterized membrane protein YhdT